MKFVITGGAGFIGSHLVEQLISSGNEVVILDDFSTGEMGNLSLIQESTRLQIRSGNLLDRNLVESLVSNSDGCFHLGAALGVTRILERPFESLKTNIQGTENVIESAARSRVKLFIASTSEIYGKNSEQPLSEVSDRVIGSPKNFRWAYSEAKAIDESLAEMFRISHGLKYVIGRFFNTVGPRQKGMYGMVLPRFVHSAINGKALTIYGTGSQSRTFCHVTDAVSAVVTLMQDTRAENEIFNIGGTEEVSIRELAERVISITGSSSRIEYVSYEDAYPIGFEETMRRVPDTTKLRTLTGWKPKRNLNEIIKDIENYFRSKS